MPLKDAIKDKAAMKDSERQTFYVTEQLSEHMGETPEGFLVCYDVPITRTGVFEYKGSEVPVEANYDGLVKIERDEEEVFSEDTIKSFEGKPITLNHPSDFVTPENWSKLAHGVVQNVRRGQGEMADLLLADLCLTTEDSIDLVKSGLREVSCGYDAEYEQVEKGIGRQKNIIGNHIALVIKGRAGNRCAIYDKNSVDGQNNDEEDVLMKAIKTKDTIKKIFSKFLDGVKDEDLIEGGGEQGGDGTAVAQQAAAEAKEAAERAVAAAQEASEAVKSITEGSGEEGSGGLVEEEEILNKKKLDEEGKVDDQDPLEEFKAEVRSKLESLEAMIKKLLDAEAGEGHEELSGDEDLTEEELLAKKKEIEDQNPDEEKLDEEEFQDTASRAEIIDPDLVVNKPIGDSAKYLQRVRKVALKNALTGDHRTIVQKLLKTKTVDSLSKDSLNRVFFAASELIAEARDSKLQKSSMTIKDYGKETASEISKIQALNKDFYSRKE